MTITAGQHYEAPGIGKLTIMEVYEDEARVQYDEGLPLWQPIDEIAARIADGRFALIDEHTIMLEIKVELRNAARWSTDEAILQHTLEDAAKADGASNVQTQMRENVCILTGICDAADWYHVTNAVEIACELLRQNENIELAITQM